MESKKQAIFMMGGPASGKSTVRRERFPGVQVLDSDDFKQAHPDYDPKNPQVLHAWSAQELVKSFFKALSSDEDFVYDGTGSTAEKYVYYLKEASSAGFETTVVYVKTSLKTALQRNSKRERVVPESIVREKHALIATSFDIVSEYADHVSVVRT